MSRLSAWVILLAAAGLIYSLTFTSYDHQTGAWTTTESGGLTRITVECPPPYRVLIFGAEPQGGSNEGQCVPSSRTLAVEAGVVALAAGLLVWKPVTRRKPDRIEPLSKQLSLPGISLEDRARTATPDD